MTDNIKAKGEELLGKFYNAIDVNMVGIGGDRATLAVCIIAVEEIINTLNRDIRDLDVRGNVLLDLIEYWRQVLNYLKSKQ